MVSSFLVKTAIGYESVTFTLCSAPSIAIRHYEPARSLLPSAECHARVASHSSTELYPVDISGFQLSGVHWFEQK